MGSDINYLTLNDRISSFNKGITPKYSKSATHTIVLNQKCIRDGIVDYSLSQFIAEDQSFTDQKVVQEGDILINSTGQGTAGRSAYVENLPGETVVVDSHMLIVRFENKKWAKMLAYCLYKEEDLLLTLLTGSSGQGELNSDIVFNNLRFPFSGDFNLEFSAQLLNIIDDKIALNTRMNDELGKTARLIYDYWFVQFDFPDSEGRPYKSSGGKMLYSQELKRDIPASWVITALDSIAEFSTGQLDPSSSPNTSFRYYSIPGFDKTGSYIVESGKQIKSNKFLVTVNDILVSKLNPWFKRIVFTPNYDNMISSTEFVVLRQPDNALKSFIYMVVNDASFIRYCTTSSSGTSNSHKRINPEIMGKYPIAYDILTAEKLGKLLIPLHQQQVSNIDENQKLSELRDWLLPMLMTGQVKVAA